MTAAITIRPAYADDAVAIERLAALDCARVPRGPLLVAEVDGEIRVAMSVPDLNAVADPFHRTRELVALLRDHIERRPGRRKRMSSALLRGRRPRVA